MQTCQVYGHYDKMARTQKNIQNNTKTPGTPRQQTIRKNYFCVFVLFL